VETGILDGGDRNFLVAWRETCEVEKILAMDGPLVGTKCPVKYCIVDGRHRGRTQKPLENADIWPFISI